MRKKLETQKRSTRVYLGLLHWMFIGQQLCDLMWLHNANNKLDNILIDCCFSSFFTWSLPGRGCDLQGYHSMHITSNLPQNSSIQHQKLQNVRNDNLLRYYTSSKWTSSATRSIWLLSSGTPNNSLVGRCAPELLITCLFVLGMHCSGNLISSANHILLVPFFLSDSYVISWDSHAGYRPSLPWD